jgi:4-amino-4-deoxy-L-arabinose transferase-like glycosyltransferase
MNWLSLKAARCLDSGRAIYVIVGLGLGIRIVSLAMVGAHSLSSENLGYDQMALQLIRHENFAPYFPPGVPYLLLLAHKLLGAGIVVARAAILPIYVVFSFLLYALAKELATRRAANLAVLAFALYPSYIRWSFSPTTEYPTAACLVGVAYFVILTVRRRSSMFSGVLGLFVGALALSRASSLPLVALAPLYVFAKTRKTTLAITTILVAAIPIGAWVWKTSAMTGRWIFVNESNWQNFYMANNPRTPLFNTCPGGPVEWDAPMVQEMLQGIESQPPEVQQRMYRDIAVDYVESRPDLFLLRSLNRFRTFFGFPIHRGEPLAPHARVRRGHHLLGLGITAIELCFYWPIMILAVIFLCTWRGPFLGTDHLTVILGTILIYSVPYWLSCSQPRYNFPVIPLFAVLAATLLDSLVENSWKDVKQSLAHSAGRRYAMLLALALFAYIQVEWIVFVSVAGAW